MAELDTGAVIGDGRYVIVSLLGTGGMGAVYRARDTKDDSLCAIKILRETRGDLATRFVREARIAAALAHPNIARVHEVLELEDGTPAIVMELLEGESLGARLARTGKLAAPAIARIGIAVVSAIRTAHQRGVIHRDLKPDNVFLCEDGAVKVLDFGIAKVIFESDDPAITAAALTDTGQILGTPQYMAPEQIFGEKDIDARADVWSLGVILYQSLAGVRPFEGANPGQIFKAIALDPPTPLSERAPGTPKELADLVGRMLVHARADRLADLEEAERVLERIAKDELGEAATIRASAIPRPRRLRPVLLYVAAAACALGGAVVVALRPPPPADPVPAAPVTAFSAPVPLTTASPSASVPDPAPEPVASASASAVVAIVRPPPKPTAVAPAAVSAPIDAGAPHTNRSGPLKRDEF